MQSIAGVEMNAALLRSVENGGGKRCVEAYAGRGALEQRARREARKRKTVLLDLQAKRGRDSLTSGIWLRALEARDAVATELLEEAAMIPAALALVPARVQSLNAW